MNRLRTLALGLALAAVVAAGLYGRGLLDAVAANMVSIQAVGPSNESAAGDGQAGCRTGHARGRLYLLRGEHERALPELERAAPCLDTSWAWLDLGRAEYELGWLERAAHSWGRAGAYGYAARLAQEVGRAGDPADALTHWRLAAQVDPNEPRTYFELARLSSQAGCQAESVALFERALELGLSGELADEARRALQRAAQSEPPADTDCPMAQWP